MIRFISLLAALVAIILVAAFSYRNAQWVTVDLFIYSVNLPLSVWLIMILVLGIALGFFANLLVLLNQKKKYALLKSKSTALSGLDEVLKKTGNKHR